MHPKDARVSSVGRDSVNPDDSGARVARAEARIEGLQAAVEANQQHISQLAETVKSGFRDLHSEISRTAADSHAEIAQIAASNHAAIERLTQKTYPNLSAWGTWAGVVLSIVFAIGAAVGWGFTRDMTRVETAIAKDNDYTLLQAKAEGRAEAIQDRLRRDQERDAENTKLEFSKLDDRLQREMRQINETTEAKISGLDARIQQEISTLAATITARVGSLSDRLDETIERVTHNALDNRTQDERLRAVERAGFGGK